MSEKKTEIDLKEGTQIFEFAGLKGFGVGKTTVEFNASKEIVAEHLAAAGRSDLIPLLNDESFTFSPETGEVVATGEDVPVFNPAEDLATEDQTKASLEAKTVAELKDLAKNFEIDLGEATKKADIINVILPQIITSEKAEELGIE